jgi:hypothetical protein
MKKKKNILIISGFILITIVFIMILFSISIYTLELKTFDESKLIFKQRIFPGDEFTLKYTHSVALTPVWEIFIINKDYQIVLIETDFLDHGAGLPYTTFENEIFVEEEGRFKIKNMHRTIYTPFYYRIGAIRENIFYFKDEVIDLSSLVGDRLLTIEIDRNNLFNYLIGGSL